MILLIYPRWWQLGLSGIPLKGTIYVTLLNRKGTRCSRIFLRIGTRWLLWYILFKAGNAFLKVQILGMRQQNRNLTTLIILFPLTYRCSQNCKMFVDYSSKKPILRSHYFYLSSSKLISKPLIVMTTAVQQRLSDNNFPHLCKP